MNRFCSAVTCLVILGLPPGSLAQNPNPAVPDCSLISGDGSFVVTEGEIPTYPALAISAGIEGTVEVQVTVVLGTVTKAETPATSNVVLTTAAKKTVMSWKFLPDQSGSFKTTFSFELAKEKVLRAENPEIQMKLPFSARLVARKVQPLTIVN